MWLTWPSPRKNVVWEPGCEIGGLKKNREKQKHTRPLVASCNIKSYMAMDFCADAMGTGIPKRKATHPPQISCQSVFWAKRSQIPGRSAFRPVLRCFGASPSKRGLCDPGWIAPSPGATDPEKYLLVGLSWNNSLFAKGPKGDSFGHTQS